MREESLPLRKVAEYVSGELTNSRLAMGLLVKSFLEKYGGEAVETAKRAVYQAGRVVGDEMAQSAEDKSIQTLVKLMLSSPYDQIFDAKLEELGKDKAVIHWRRCPVKEKFERIGFQEKLIKTLCQVMEQYDAGIIEGFNSAFKCVPPAGPPGPCKCQIYIKKTSS